MALITRAQGGIPTRLYSDGVSAEIGLTRFMCLAGICLSGSGWVNYEWSHGQTSVGGVAMW